MVGSQFLVIYFAKKMCYKDNFYISGYVTKLNEIDCKKSLFYFLG